MNGILKQYYRSSSVLEDFVCLFVYLFLAALGLHCCARAFSSCGKRGVFFVVMHGLLIVVASFVVDHGL